MTETKATDLLIAPPGLPDSRFRNSVLMLTHHHSGGSFALCINRLSRHTLQDIVDELDLDLDCELNFPLYWGGPVSPNTIWMLHSGEWAIEGSTVEIDDKWSMTSTEEMFYCLADGDCPKHFRIVYGYSSWSAGQLDCELMGVGPYRPEHSWLVATNPGPDWIMDHPVEDLWAETTRLSSQQAVDSWL